MSMVVRGHSVRTRKDDEDLRANLGTGVFGGVLSVEVSSWCDDEVISCLVGVLCVSSFGFDGVDNDGRSTDIGTVVSVGNKKLRCTDVGKDL